VKLPAGPRSRPAGRRGCPGRASSRHAHDRTRCGEHGRGPRAGRRRSRTSSICCATSVSCSSTTTPGSCSLVGSSRSSPARVSPPRCGTACSRLSVWVSTSRPAHVEFRHATVVDDVNIFVSHDVGWTAEQLAHVTVGLVCACSRSSSRRSAGNGAVWWPRSRCRALRWASVRV
jgi:hypothetical protein